MITNKDSWKFLAAFFVVLLITVWAGIGCYNSDIDGAKTMGILNMLLGGAIVGTTYLKFRDKD